mmetsp:Transcript_35150/g.69013  ORF Transcript_35150/g.69013 Transcript_35150/m.69013 type:complete len:362 (+) Transcript_35150:91-1176(+)
MSSLAVCTLENFLQRLPSNETLGEGFTCSRLEFRNHMAGALDSGKREVAVVAGDIARNLLVNQPRSPLFFNAENFAKLAGPVLVTVVRHTQVHIAVENEHSHRRLHQLWVHIFGLVLLGGVVVELVAPSYARAAHTPLTLGGCSDVNGDLDQRFVQVAGDGVVVNKAGLRPLFQSNRHVYSRRRSEPRVVGVLRVSEHMRRVELVGGAGIVNVVNVDGASFTGGSVDGGLTCVATPVALASGVDSLVGLGRDDGTVVHEIDIDLSTFFCRARADFTADTSVANHNAFEVDVAVVATQNLLGQGWHVNASVRLPSKVDVTSVEFRELDQELLNCIVVIDSNAGVIVVVAGLRVSIAVPCTGG